MTSWVFPISFLLAISLPSFLFRQYAAILLKKNIEKRREVLSSLGVPEAEHKKRKLVGFFHPYCNAGGGGERVLWTAVALLQRKDPDIVSVVYSGDIDASKEEIIARVDERFSIVLDPSTLHFVFLKSRYLVEDSSWPHFTLLGQSLGSMYLIWEAMTKLIPDLYIDTMGYAFTYPIVRALSADTVPVGAYVHFPTISTSMLSRVRTRASTYANSQRISSSPLLSNGKLLYYRVFMWMYANALRRAAFVMANSTWTKEHIDGILGYHDWALDGLIGGVGGTLSMLSLTGHILEKKASPEMAQIVYPPCETQELVTFPLEGREKEKKIIVSIAQFRPEKDHAAQLRSLAELFKEHPMYREEACMVLIGGCRNAEDDARVKELEKLAVELDIRNSVSFIVNAPHPTVLSWLSRASVGMNTMVDEHFGINVVEFLAAGVIPVVHASAGPLKDIVVPYQGKPTGFHATDPLGFAQKLYEALSMSEEEKKEMRERGRKLAVERFSRAGFEDAWEASGWRQWLPHS